MEGPGGAVQVRHGDSKRGREQAGGGPPVAGKRGTPAGMFLL